MLGTLFIDYAKYMFVFASQKAIAFISKGLNNVSTLKHCIKDGTEWRALGKTSEQ